MNAHVRIKQIETLFDEIVQTRRALHAHPELGNQEFWTANFIENFLRGLGLKPKRLISTAVVCDLSGSQPGPCILLRSDIDALPITEETGLDFRSQNKGCMHACGHDFHMTAALYAAKILSQERNSFSGTIRFVFQPDEEGDGGAERLIQAGVLDGVDAAFGMHVNPELPPGHIGIKEGPFYAAAGKWDVTLIGTGAHAAERSQGKDALLCAARMVAALDSLNSDDVVLTCGMFHSGTARNILADKAELSGIVRCLGRERRDTAHLHVERIIHDISDEMGVVAHLRWVDGYVGVVNHHKACDVVKDVAIKLLGNEQVDILDRPTFTTEDFGYYIEDILGCFYHVGVGSDAGLHSSHFMPDERALIAAVATHVEVLLASLRQKGCK